MHKFDLDIKNISKIEGHTHMLVRVRNGKVKECKLRISENQRFYKKAMEGLVYNLVPGRMSRICGTCSSAHALCSLETIEKAFNVPVSDQTYKLRRLLINAGHIRDHAMHLYFFCLPDVFHKESVFDFKGPLHKWIHYGLDVKDAGNYLATIVGGRAVYPPFPAVGGFTQYAKKEEMKQAIKKLGGVRNKILEIIDVFYKDKKTFKRKANYVALVNNDYNYLKGMIKTSKGTLIPEEKYGEHLQQVVLPYATAAGFKFESKDYMVGALARMNLNRNNMQKATKKDCKKYFKIFPNNCVFNNNLAQAIETLHGVDVSMQILEELQGSLKKEKLPKITPRQAVGVGVVEAPRGTLYYKFDFAQKGIVTNVDICIPTQQNVIHLEKDVAKYIEQLLAKGVKKDKISLEIEEMIRAYDPCMSCATHFLKIDWV